MVATAAVALAFGGLAARGVPTGFAVENVGPTLTNPTNIEFAPNGRVFVAEHAGVLKTWPSLQDFESSQNQSVFADLRTNVHGFWDRGFDQWSNGGSRIQTITVPMMSTIYTATYIGANEPPVAVISADPSSGPAPLLVEFDGSGSFDPDEEEIIAYSWDLDDDGIFDDATGPLVSEVFGPGTHVVRLMVTDARDLPGVSEIEITATNTTPTATIGAPSAGTQWSVGQVINLSGSGSDPEDGSIPGSGLTWEIRHFPCAEGGGCAGTLIHLFNGTAGSFQAPDSEYPARIEINLTATDQFGLTHTATRTLLPNSVALTFATDPTGLQLLIEGDSQTTPYVGTFVMGSSIEIEAPTSQPSGNPWFWVFQSWSQGGTASQTIVAPAAATTFTATYAEANAPPIAVIQATPVAGSAPLTVEFDASESFDPDSDTIVEYAWDLNNDGNFGDATGLTASRVFDPGLHIVHLRVTDARGGVGFTFVEITATNTPPTPAIALPTAGTLWSVGETISFSGTAVDTEGTIPPSDLSWEVVHYPCASSCTGQVLGATTGAGGSFTAPESPYPSRIEISLTATDQYGLAATVTRVFLPRTTTLTFATDPSGRQLRVNGETFVAPQNRTFVTNSNVQLVAPSPQPGSTFTSVWVFTGWSHGGAATQSITTPTTNTTYTASFTEQLGEGSGASFGLVDPTSGQWFLRDPVTGATTSFYYGIPGDFPIVGDWNCNGVATPGMYRQSTGFVYLRNSNNQGVADLSFFFGIPGDIPLVGDFNGDGCDTVSIYRPSQQRFFITNQLGSGDQGFVAEFSFVFGNPGDKPFTGDFDNDGRTEVGLHRESTGLVYLRYTLTTGFADALFFFGNPGDRLIAGNWIQSGTPGPETVGLFRPSNSTFYLRFDNSQGNADFSFGYGLSHMIPVAGHFGVLPGGAPAPGLPAGGP